MAPSNNRRTADRASEVRYLAERVGITEVHASQSPEQKLELVRVQTIALQSAVSGMALSVLGMLVAAAGSLPPVAGALVQEVIDVVVVVNALRAALPPRALSDY